MSMYANHDTLNTEQVNPKKCTTHVDWPRLLNSSEATNKRWKWNLEDMYRRLCETQVYNMLKGPLPAAASLEPPSAAESVKLQVQRDPAKQHKLD